MIDLNIKHPKFALEMEVLATLPAEPDHAEFREVAQDLGLSHKSLAPIAQSLLRRGLRINRERRNGRLVLSIPKAQWPRAKHAAEKYFADVYGY